MNQPLQPRARTTDRREADRLEADAAEFRAAFARLVEQCQRRIVGQAEVVRGVLVALFADGHVLLEGSPGLGKTLLVHTVAQAVGAEFKRVQCTPDLMPADVVGTRVLAEDADGRRVFAFEPGPVFAAVLLADELNRATPKTQSALLEAMQERAVTVAGERRPLPPEFFVLATQNPIDMEGTYPLPEAQLDRFLLKLHVGSPELEHLRRIARETTGAAPAPVEQVLSVEDVLRIRALACEVPLAPHAEALAAGLVYASHPERDEAPARVRRCVRFGASPRGVQALVRAARVEALVDGRFVVAPEDVRAWALPALRHRLILNVEAELEGLSADDVVEELLASVPDEE